MPFESTTCPYCNARVAVPERATAGQRLLCPRCDEMFPVLTSANGSQAAADFSTVESAEEPALRRGRPRWSNFTIAGLVLGVMAGAAVVALMFALQTVPQRRALDPKTPLGYLPADTNVVAGLLVSETLKQPAGQDFLQNFRLGHFSLSIGNVERWTGLRRDEIRQIVVGLKVEGLRAPRVIIVVQTHEPYSLQSVRDALKADREVRRGDKTLYRFRLEQGVFEPHLWCPAERILVVGLAETDLDPVPPGPQPGFDHLPGPIQTGLSQPMGEGAHAWLIAHHEHWDHTSVGWLLSGLGGADQETLAKMQTACFWLHFDEAVRFHAACCSTDADAARAFQEFVVRRESGEEQHVELRNDGWVTIESQTSPKEVRQTIEKAIRGPLGLFSK